MPLGQVGQEGLAQTARPGARFDHFIRRTNIELGKDLGDVHLVNNLGLMGDGKR